MYVYKYYIYIYNFIYIYVYLNIFIIIPVTARALVAAPWVSGFSSIAHMVCRLRVSSSMAQSDAAVDIFRSYSATMRTCQQLISRARKKRNGEVWRANEREDEEHNRLPQSITEGGKSQETT